MQKKKKVDEMKYKINLQVENEKKEKHKEIEAKDSKIRENGIKNKREGE
jgi:hypothetical protein